jgi:hypothetical protein
MGNNKGKIGLAAAAAVAVTGYLISRSRRNSKSSFEKFVDGFTDAVKSIKD